MWLVKYATLALKNFLRVRGAKWPSARSGTGSRSRLNSFEFDLNSSQNDQRYEEKLALCCGSASSTENSRGTEKHRRNADDIKTRPTAMTLDFFKNYDVCSSVFLDELGLERLEHVRLKQLAVTMYKIHNNLSPSYLRRIFTNTSNVHSHNLRNSELNYYVPRPRTESAKGSLHYRGSVLWNRIPSEIKKLPSLNVFKT